MADKIFVDGLRFEKPREGSPEFIKGRVSINVSRLTKWLKEHGEGQEWLNIDLKKSKEKGTLYLELNTYNPMSKDNSKEDEEENLPF